jgi:pyruvate dehydrogenase E2 component (dihydrolipoamide acetyltransferase)
MAQFLMPKLSDTMEEGTILRWLRADGEEVRKGEPLVEIETDKATMTVDAPEAGRLAIIAGEGESLPVGAPIASIGAGAPPAETPAPPAETPAPAAAPTPPAVEEAPALRDEEAPVVAEVAPAEAVPAGRVQEAAPAVETAPAAPPAPEAARRVRSSPLARRLAAELGVDLSRVRGSGPGGRVVRADVEAAARGEEGALRPAPAPAPEAAPQPAVAADAAASPQEAAPTAGRRIPLTRLQRTIARRMVESVTRAPHFFLERDVDVTEAVALRRTLVAAAAEGEGPSFNDLILRAVAIAASERPESLARYDGDALVVPERIDIGVAVAVERGLLVPVVRDAAAKSIGRIAAEVRDLVRRCRDGTITPSELEGSAISVSNLGMYGVDRFSAVINPPEPAILAVGRAAPRPVARNGRVAVRDVVTLTLSVDHRALYGAEGAAVLGRIAELLERPGALVL